jgi:hypothetical protein
VNRSAGRLVNDYVSECLYDNGVGVVVACDNADNDLFEQFSWNVFIS